MRFFTIVFSFVVLFIGCTVALAGTFTLYDDGSGDFPNLGTACASVTAGDTISLYPGIYHGVDIHGDHRCPGVGRDL
jgi:hypothetical protein